MTQPSPNSANIDTTNAAYPLDSHILGRMDKLAAIVASLDDATINAALPIPAINTLAVLLRHVGGSARYWLEHVCLGRKNVRDRAGEFSATGTVAEELAIFREQRAIIAGCLKELQKIDRTAAPAIIPTDKDRWWCTSIDGVIVHVFHEAAQHLGHAEITRDALLAGLGPEPVDAEPVDTKSTPDTASSKRSVCLLDAVIAELQEAGHAADFIEGERITTVDGHSINISEVVRLGVAAMVENR